MRRVVSISAILAVGLASSVPSWADDEAALRSFGLFGIWAVDCSRPPSRDNPHMSYRPGRPYPQRLLRVGRGESAFDMRNARAVGTNRLAYNDRRSGASSEGFDVVIERVGRRVRSISSVAVADGRVLIEDGRLVPTGKPTLLFELCADQASAAAAGAPAS